VGSRPGGILVVAAIVVALLVPLLGSDAAASTEPAHWQPAPIASWQVEGTGLASAVVGDTVFVGGDFSTVRSPDGATVVTRNNLAAFDLTTGALKPAFQANTNGIVRSLVVSDGQLIVGGSSSAVAVRKVTGGTASTLRTVASGQAVSTQKHWLVLRIVGSTIQFKTWLDGAVEPAIWTSTDTDAGVTAPGQLFVSVVRAGTNVGAKSVAIDDLTVSAG